MSSAETAGHDRPNHEADPGRESLEYSAEDAGTAPQEQHSDAPRYGVWLFSLREVVFLGLAALVLIGSFLPVLFSDVVGYVSIWAPFTLLAFPGVVLIVVAALLVALRRVAPKVAWRVGSLSVDQFASVAVVVTAIFYVYAVILIASIAAFGQTVVGPGVIVGLIASLAAFFVTVLAPFIPPFSGDFSGREESPAHAVARAPHAVSLRPRLPRVTETKPGTPDDELLAQSDGYPATSTSYSDQGTGLSAASLQGGPRYARSSRGGEADLGEHLSSVPEESEVIAHEDADLIEEASNDEQLAPRSAVSHVTARPDESPTEILSAVPAVVSQQPFWVYSTVPRQVVDETTGAVLFDIGPAAWALAIVDRGSELVIRHDDGRVGVLRSISDLMRG